MSFIKKMATNFLPKKCKRLIKKILCGDFHRFEAWNPRRFDWDDFDEAKKSILWYTDWNEATEKTLAFMEKMGLMKPNLFIIDWGCGIGRISNELVKRYGATVLAVDRSTKMLNHAFNYITPNCLSQIMLVTDDFVLSNLSFFKKCADLIIFIEVLQHIPELYLDNLLPKIAQLLKEDGKIFVFGNKELDICYKRKTYSTVEEVIKRHFNLGKTETISLRYRKKIANILFEPGLRYGFVANLRT